MATVSRPASEPTLPLGRRLPHELTLPADVWLLHYRRYPVFSPKWLGWRSVLFGVGLLMVSLFSGFGYALLTRSYRVGAEVTLLAFASMYLAYFAVPILGTLVRLWKPRGERRWIVVAGVVGFAIAYLVEERTNAYFLSLLDGTAMKGVWAARLDLSQGEKTVSTVFGLAFRFSVYALLGGGFALRGYFVEQRRWRELFHQQALAELRAQKQESELRLGVLQAQVEPHFLFNTLASVRALVRHDAARAEATLDALVAYLRATIPKMRDDDAALDSTLGQQLEICASYLELMRLRTVGRLQYAIDVDPALRALAFPPMLLITLVENAIKHGIEPRPGPGQVVIAAVREGDLLQVSVVDDGQGLQPGVGGGLGLANVRAQLDNLFGGRAALSLRSEQPRGTRAELRIPVEGGAA